MRFRLATAGSLLIVSLTVGGSPNKGQDQNHSSTVRGPDKQERPFAVNLVRAINTAEMAYRDKEGGSFAEWNALSASQGFKQAIDNFSRDVPRLKDLDLSAPTEITPGWRLRLTVSLDKQSYVVVLTSKSDKDCSYALVSDEEGVIREARAIGCPEH